MTNVKSKMTMKALVIPILFESILKSLMGTVNVLLMSKVSDEAVGAIGVANQYIGLIQWMLISMSLGCVVCVTQALGLDNKKRAAQLTTIALALTFVFGIVFSLMFLTLSGAFLSIMSLPASAIADAKNYMMIVGGGMLVTGLSAVFGNILRVHGNTRMPLYINIVSNVCNIAGTFYVVNYTNYGVVGVGCANIISQTIAMLFALCMFLRAGTGASLRYIRPIPWSDVKLALSLGIPCSIDSIAYSLSQLVTTAFISGLGTLVVTAKVYVENIVQYSALIGMCVGQAGEVLVSYHLGERQFDTMNRVRRNITITALCTNTLFSLVCILFRKQFLSAFTSDPEIIALAASIIAIDIFVEWGRALNNTLSGSLRGVGDVKFTMTINFASAWLVSVGVSYLLGVKLGMGLHGLWIAFAADELVRGLFLLRRWVGAKWRPRAEARLDLIDGKTTA